MCRVTVITSLFNSHQYLEGYFEAVQEIRNKEEIEILLIHNAPNDAELTIINKFLPRFPFIKHHIVEREGLYATWNRGIQLAKGKYVTVWNVDDVRLPESLIHQADALDNNSDAALSYGDFVMVKRYGDREGKPVHGPEFQKGNRTFLQAFHITCFPMWRKDIHSAIGYFDEQFRIVADFDFQIRVLRKYNLVKVNKPIGFYLEGTPSNLSSNYSLQDLELNALHLRYGNFNLLNLPQLLNTLRKIKVFSRKWYGSFHKVKGGTFLDSCNYLIRFPLIFMALVKFPRHVARKYLKHHIAKWSPKKADGELSSSAL